MFIYCTKPDGTKIGIETNDIVFVGTCGCTYIDTKNKGRQAVLENVIDVIRAINTATKYGKPPPEDKVDDRLIPGLIIGSLVGSVLF